MSNASASRNTIRSLDGTREITVEEFDRLFDNGSDEIDDFIDLSKAVGQGDGPGTCRLGLDLPLTLLGRLDSEADRRGLGRDALIAEWVVERVRAIGATAPHGQAAE